MDFDFIIALIVILVVFLPFAYIVDYREDINNYDISNAILIDNFISYTRFGNPRYFLVYKFEDSSIMEFQVTADEYYRLGECE